jgi:uncharacterized protein involved in exopolysaccharide biosynthesis
MTGKSRTAGREAEEREQFDFARAGGNGPYPGIGDVADRGDRRTETVASVRLLWERRGFLGRWAACGFVLFLILAFLIPVQYESIAKLMPPDQSGAGLGMMLSALTGGGGTGGGAGASAMTSIGSDLLGLKTTGDLFAGVMQSRTVEDDLIGKFGLQKEYGTKTLASTRTRLGSHTEINIDKKTGIIELRVTDHDRQRAAALGQEYIADLDNVLVDLNTGSAHRERVFLEGRLSQVNQDLESAEKEFSQFSSKNSALDIKEQGRAMVEAAAQLEGELIGAETSLQGMKQIYTDSNVRVRATAARIAELKRQILKMGGKPEDRAAGGSGASADTGSSSSGGSTNASASPNVDSMYPTMRQLPLLGVNYADLLRRTRVEEAIFETLTREYELAKVEEAKEIPSVKVLDAPDVPERKSFPPRGIITLLGLLLGLGAAIGWTFGTVRWDARDANDPAKILALEVFTTVRGSVQGMLHNGARNGHAASSVVPPEDSGPDAGRSKRG